MVPFWVRFVGLLVLLALGAALDRWKRGDRATRPREYAFLVACGLLGAIFAIGVDHIDATISREYFTIGKELPDGPRFRLAVTWLGFQAGLTPGLVIGGLLLLANQPVETKPVLPSLRLARFVLIPLSMALAFAVVGAIVIPRLDPQDDHKAMSRFLTPDEIDRFLTVWGIHLGLYAGGALGAVVAAVLARRSR